ncbi:uncharacterized protein LOC131668214 [Phymastichus coffea]|uniref:uncharacterized protein LOC131668214 n=1 Tax=Phymastichus coffea TaxID=108790 RepID=UPI00273B32D9|nr:uncharacterized protein LOC131668214 [Phymastichus coffea]
MLIHVDWVEALPLVLLGIRSAFKVDIGSSSAELVYGESLRLPGEMLTAQAPNAEDMPVFLAALREHMARLRPTSASRHSKPGTFVFKELERCTHVFLREGPERRSLQQPYRGPYEIIDRNDKNMTLKINNIPNTVTIDRVFPAFILNDDEPPPPSASTPIPVAMPPPTHPPQLTPPPVPPSSKPEVTTRSGRRVRLPVRFQT